MPSPGGPISQPAGLEPGSNLSTCIDIWIEEAEVSHRRIVELASEIAAERDSKKLILLLDELCELLAAEVREIEMRIGKRAA
jgi:hypothetical protein